MFNCQECGNPTGPRVKPIVAVTETRNREYLIENENEELIIGAVGTEIVKEVKLCPPCAGADAPAEPVEVDFESANAMAKVYHEHARSCPGRKPIKKWDNDLKQMVKVGEEDCKQCQRGIAFFRELPLNVLNYVLGEHSPVKRN
jgi:hypothetical protein